MRRLKPCHWLARVTWPITASPIGRLPLEHGSQSTCLGLSKFVASFSTIKHIQRGRSMGCPTDQWKQSVAVLSQWEHRMEVTWPVAVPMSAFDLVIEGCIQSGSIQVLYRTFDRWASPGCRCPTARSFRPPLRVIIATPTLGGRGEFYVLNSCCLTFI